MTKKYHKGAEMNQRGGVSALCFKRPRAIDLTQALWTNRDEAVICPDCLRILKNTNGGTSLFETAPISENI